MTVICSDIGTKVTSAISDINSLDGESSDVCRTPLDNISNVCDGNRLIHFTSEDLTGKFFSKHLCLVF